MKINTENNNPFSRLFNQLADLFYTCTFMKFQFYITYWADKLPYTQNIYTYKSTFIYKFKCGYIFNTVHCCLWISHDNIARHEFYVVQNFNNPILNDNTMCSQPQTIITTRQRRLFSMEFIFNFYFFFLSFILWAAFVFTSKFSIVRIYLVTSPHLFILHVARNIYHNIRAYMYIHTEPLLFVHHNCEINLSRWINSIDESVIAQWTWRRLIIAMRKK